MCFRDLFSSETQYILFNNHYRYCIFTQSLTHSLNEILPPLYGWKLPIRRKTIFNQSINQSNNQSTNYLFLASKYVLILRFSCILTISGVFYKVTYLMKNQCHFYTFKHYIFLIKITADATLIHFKKNQALLFFLKQVWLC